VDHGASWSARPAGTRTSDNVQLQENRWVTSALRRAYDLINDGVDEFNTAKAGYVFSAGGPIWGLDWCPYSDNLAERTFTLVIHQSPLLIQLGYRPYPAPLSAKLMPRRRFRLRAVHRHLPITAHRDATRTGREVASLLESWHPNLVRRPAVFASTTAGRRRDAPRGDAVRDGVVRRGWIGYGGQVDASRSVG
jgi:hypothetical protein